MNDISANLVLSSVQAAVCLGIDERTVRRWVSNGKLTAYHDETDGRKPISIPLNSLPEAAQKKYLAEHGDPIVACRSAVTELVPLVQPVHAANGEPDERYCQLWAWYEKQDSKAKRKAESALTMMDDFALARNAGVSIGIAEAAIRAKYGTSNETLWRLRTRVDGHPRQHWLPLLAPRYCGNGQAAEFTEEAYEWILARHLSQTQIKTSVLVRLARQEGAPAALLRHRGRDNRRIPGVGVRADVPGALGRVQRPSFG